jgi:hypothetical protein
MANAANDKCTLTNTQVILPTLKITCIRMKYRERDMDFPFMNLRLEWQCMLLSTSLRQ